jgi:3,4-dihydroxy-2-butanone 4-phosphate synthase
MPRSSIAERPAAGAVDRALEAVREGRLVVLAEDSEDGIGDLVTAADRVTSETTVFMVTYGGGILYVTLDAARCDELGLEPQNPSADSRFWVADLRMLVDARVGVTTGISAADRTLTMHTLADPASTRDDLAGPGHIVPFAARPGGTLQRADLGEGALDLTRLAGAAPGAAEAELLNPDGSRARGADLRRFAAEHGLPYVTVGDIVDYRRELAGPEAAAASVEYQRFRDFFGQVPAPVSVVATTTPDGRAHVTTVSAFCSLSAEPALLLVALARSSDLLAHIRRARRFSVNVLAAEQDGIALQCAAKGAHKLPEAAWERLADDPRLTGVAAWCACTVERVVDGGDHEIVIGRVVDCEVGSGRPLVHHDRAFHELLPRGAGTMTGPPQAAGHERGER